MQMRFWRHNVDKVDDDDKYVNNGKSSTTGTVAKTYSIHSIANKKQITMMSSIIENKHRCVNPKSRFSTKSTRLYLFLILFMLCSFATGEDVNDVENGNKDAAASAEGSSSNVDDVEEAGFDDDDWIFVVIMSLLFAFCISLFGTILGYISLVDDRLMKQYDRESFIVIADVCCSEFARGGAGQTICLGKSQREYLATIEYNQLLSETYRIRIRKQVRALDSDFCHPEEAAAAIAAGTAEASIMSKSVTEDVAESPRNATNMMMMVSAAPRRTFSSAKKERQQKQNQRNQGGPVIVNQDSFLQRLMVEHRKLEICVLQEKPKSGYPKRQVDRKLSYHYRLSSLGFVLSTTLLSIFCFYIAIRTIIDEEDEEHQKSGWMVIWIFVVLIIMQLPCVHLVLHAAIKSALEEEYFEMADFAPTGQDDSSLSSGSDMFLSSIGGNTTSTGPGGYYGVSGGNSIYSLT